MNISPSYNGWSNRETWLANLWLNHNEASHRIIRAAYQQSNNRFDQAHWLEDVLREMLYRKTQEASLWSDLIHTSFDRINWQEIIDGNVD